MNKLQFESSNFCFSSTTSLHFPRDALAHSSEILRSAKSVSSGSGDKNGSSEIVQEIMEILRPPHRRKLQQKDSVTEYCNKHPNHIVFNTVYVIFVYVLAYGLRGNA